MSVLADLAGLRHDANLHDVLFAQVLHVHAPSLSSEEQHFTLSATQRLDRCASILLAARFAVVGLWGLGCKLRYDMGNAYPPACPPPEMHVCTPVPRALATARNCTSACGAAVAMRASAAHACAQTMLLCAELGKDAELRDRWEVLVHARPHARSLLREGHHRVSLAYFYQGGVTHVMTGGVMLGPRPGSGRHPVPAPALPSALARPRPTTDRSRTTARRRARRRTPACGSMHTPTRMQRETPGSRAALAEPPAAGPPAAGPPAAGPRALQRRRAPRDPPRGALVKPGAVQARASALRLHLGLRVTHTRSPPPHSAFISASASASHSRSGSRSHSRSPGPQAPVDGLPPLLELGLVAVGPVPGMGKGFAGREDGRARARREGASTMKTRRGCIKQHDGKGFKVR
ncbi:hypothetical protein GGX14DRAFT_577576 [Mycena pura]|uniref:Uncharacterized protein n=1 Tax=Mycena pura TaxID=153505 RepID=A0AAD6UR66_9AGAR|nr:hypothetical protein GGX14DRAFT_577576 [Mycena pura]